MDAAGPRAGVESHGGCFFVDRGADGWFHAVGHSLLDSGVLTMLDHGDTCSMLLVELRGDAVVAGLPFTLERGSGCSPQAAPCVRLPTRPADGQLQ